MRNSRFKVYGRFDSTRTGEATVTVERATGLIHVRPYRRKRTFTLPLADVGEMIVWHVVKAEVREKLAAKRKQKRGRKYG